MTLTERMEVCRRVIRQYQAELIGLQSVYHTFPDVSHCYTNPDDLLGYQRGRAEGMDILQKGEGR